MKHRVEHRLTQEQARHLAAKAIEHYQRRFSHHIAEARWCGPNDVEVTFAVRGMRVCVTCALLPGAIELQAYLPWALRLLTRRALRTIDGEIKREISKWEAG